MTKELILTYARHYLAGFKFHLGYVGIPAKSAILYINPQGNKDYITISAFRRLIKQ